jgi:catechol-2,3-dioxygenase
MTTRPAIADIGHVALRTRDLDRAVFMATNVMGLREVERRDDWVYLTHGAEHHTLMYRAAAEDAVDHIGLEAAGEEGLATVRERVALRGLEVVSDGPLYPGVTDGFAFVGDGGFVYDVSTGVARDQPSFHPTGVRPQRLGHINLHPEDPDAARAFFEDVLDFRLSDTITGQGYFLRCNSEHHGVALLRGRGTLHHHAWQVESIADLGRLADLLDEQRIDLLWGPLRHGAGNNVAAYFAEPAGTVVEFYADMEHIYDEASFVPRTWDADDKRWYSRWSPGRPADFRSFGLKPAARP